MPPESAQGRNGTRDLELIAKIGAEAMGVIQYDAIGLGGGDFSLGADFLRKIASDAGIKLVATNVIHRNGGQPFGDRYAVVDVGDIRVGVLSVLPLGAFDDISDRKLVEGLEIITPETAIKAVMPELKEKTDIIILLSQYGLARTRLLVGMLDGIDLSICCGDMDSGGGCGGGESGVESKEPFIKASYRGGRLGYVHLDLDAGGKAAVSRSRMIPLDQSISDDAQIVAITGTNIKDKVEEARGRQLIGEIKELHKLSPAEYVEILTKQQTTSRDAAQ